MPGRYFGYWATVCGFFACVFAIACFATDRWYVIEMPGPITVSLGLRSMCIRTDFSSDSQTGEIDSTVISTALGGEAKCGSLVYDTEKLSCNATRTDIGAMNRSNATFGLAAAGSALMAICFLYLVVTNCMKDESQSTVIRACGFVFSLLSMICCCAGMALYYHTMDYWLFCDMEYCAYWNTLSPCDTSFGYSFYFLVFAVILSCFVALSLLFGCCNHASGVDRDGEKLGAAGSGTNNNNRNHNNANTSRGNVYQSSHRDPYAVGLDETWYWDDEAQYWWSDDQKLYYDEESGHYYDPESGQWYDPDTGAWYNA